MKGSANRVCGTGLCRVSASEPTAPARNNRRGVGSSRSAAKQSDASRCAGIEYSEIAFTTNAGDAAVSNTAQPAAAVSGHSPLAMRQMTRRVAPPIKGLSNHGALNQANGVSRSAKPGQYDEMRRPSGDASMNQRIGGIRRCTSSGGTCATSAPRAKIRAWNTGAYSSMESGWPR